MLIRVDPDSPRALYDQVAASIRSDILAGVLAPGDRLPAARDVAEALDINQHTVLHAYQRLRDEGLVDLRRGRGAVIAASAAPLAELAHDIDGLVRRAAALGVSADTLAGIIQSHRDDRTEPTRSETREEDSP
ncbi:MULTISPECIES: GntR family transcriptional regulator [unclassified Microbacterium]|uniref:GntR family transcriptional regulator n=1 Tax=unclassified Microbacterium TaxID=2609290 RepID=UPI000CFD83BF|nr:MULTISPECIES: GntR family transcriptional regulator [unclassified Microbacterium]PQZ57433.1 GntR family transcriptional regulator [Microbacterium sp. MYb43]PQZ75758.1 GntR family transcriptional regulator [Microbacterium sp. MYb40]PRB22770.1 GntR family transcriptional regulator [Microbacterium sp. MYb54]PRB28888.1 GntR family transcriptional regulator [Microbacterium sp. MYb50]PRB69036.1 GntR family transcriptional regulator [Microbacterium sp. MYb24]